MSLLEQVVYIVVLGNGCVEVSLRILCAGFSVFRVDEFGCWGIRVAFGVGLLRWWSWCCLWSGRSKKCFGILRSVTPMVIVDCL